MYNNYRLSVTSDYDCILAMLPGSKKNGRLEVTPFSVSTTSGTVSVIRRNALCNTPGLTAPDSLNTCPMCNGQRWIFNMSTVLSMVHGASKFRSWSERPSNFRVKSLLKVLVNLTQLGLDPIVNSRIDCPSLFQLRHPETPLHIGYLLNIKGLVLRVFKIYTKFT